MYETYSNLFLMVLFFLFVWLFPSSTLYKLSRLNYQFKIYPSQREQNFCCYFFQDFGWVGWGSWRSVLRHRKTTTKERKRHKTGTKLPRILLTVIYRVIFRLYSVNSTFFAPFTFFYADRPFNTVANSDPGLIYFVGIKG
jgi:hypothetical protein